MLFSFATPQRNANDLLTWPETLQPIELIGIFATAAEAHARMMDLYGLDPPCPVISAGWETAWGTAHTLTVDNRYGGCVIGEGYRYMTPHGMIRTLWVQTISVHPNPWNKIESRAGQGKGWPILKNERIRHDLIPLQYRSKGWTISEVPERWYAAPWATTSCLPGARSYSDFVVDGAGQGIWRPKMNGLPTLEEMEEVFDVLAQEDGGARPCNRIQERRGFPKELVLAFGSFPPRIIDLTSNAVSDSSRSSGGTSSGSRRGAANQSTSASEEKPSSHSSNSAVEISSPSSYHSHPNTNPGLLSGHAQHGSWISDPGPQKATWPDIRGLSDRSDGVVSMCPLSSYHPMHESLSGGRSASQSGSPYSPSCGSERQGRSSSATSDARQDEQSAEGSIRILATTPPSADSAETPDSQIESVQVPAVPAGQESGCFLMMEADDEDEENLIKAIANTKRLSWNPSSTGNQHNWFAQLSISPMEPQTFGVGGPDAEEEQSVIMRRESGSEHAKALDEVRSMFHEVNSGDGAHGLPEEPALPRMTQPASSSSWAAIASKGNAGKENINLKSSAKSSSRLALDAEFKVKVPEGW